MDSLSNLLTPYSNQTVRGIKRFLLANKVEVDTLTPVPVKVSSHILLMTPELFIVGVRSTSKPLPQTVGFMSFIT